MSWFTSIVKKFLGSPQERRNRLERERVAFEYAQRAEAKRVADAIYAADKQKKQDKFEEAMDRKIAKAVASRNREKARAAKKALKEKTAKAKAFAKSKGLRKTRRHGRQVFVNKSGNVVDYAILALLLSDSRHDDYNPREHSSDYQSISHDHPYTPSSDDSSSGSSVSMPDISFGGGDSGGGGASGGW